ncbi:unnamed protein product [Urochloa humidicola]
MDAGSHSISSCACPVRSWLLTMAPRSALQEVGTEPLHASTELGIAQPVAKCYIGDGHGHGALPAHIAQERQGERGQRHGIPIQGGVPEAARGEAAQQPEPENVSFADAASSKLQAKPAKQRRHITQSAERTLDAPELVDGYYLNLLDWGSNSVLSIALGDTVYLWEASNGPTSELVTLWDTSSHRLLRTLRGVH